jgi:hypothetical protein
MAAAMWQPAAPRRAAWGPAAATAMPPPASPSNWAVEEDMFETDRPRTYASPVSRSAMTRAAAPAKTGVPQATTATSVRLSATGRSSSPSAAASAASMP